MGTSELLFIFGQDLSEASWKCARYFFKAKEKYRGMFEIQKSGDKTSSGEIGLDIRIHASPKVRQDQVSGGVSVLCWHAAPVSLRENMSILDQRYNPP